ncbi:MAG: hypothetical protein JWP36_1101 [Paucimonas sp.]|nr:hypothetical protein [Paucimonas sp.]
MTISTTSTRRISSQSLGQEQVRRFSSEEKTPTEFVDVNGEKVDLPQPLGEKVAATISLVCGPHEAATKALAGISVIHARGPVAKPSADPAVSMTSTTTQTASTTQPQRLQQAQDNDSTGSESSGREDEPPPSADTGIRSTPKRNMLVVRSEANKLKRHEARTGLKLQLQRAQKEQLENAARLVKKSIKALNEEDQEAAKEAVSIKSLCASDHPPSAILLHNTPGMSISDYLESQAQYLKSKDDKGQPKFVILCDELPAKPEEREIRGAYALPDSIRMNSLEYQVSGFENESLTKQRRGLEEFESRIATLCAQIELTAATHKGVDKAQLKLVRTNLVFGLKEEITAQIARLEQALPNFLHEGAKLKNIIATLKEQIHVKRPVLEEIKGTVSRILLAVFSEENAKMNDPEVIDKRKREISKKIAEYANQGKTVIYVGATANIHSATIQFDNESQDDDAHGNSSATSARPLRDPLTLTGVKAYLDRRLVGYGKNASVAISISGLQNKLNPGMDRVQVIFDETVKEVGGKGQTETVHMRVPAALFLQVQVPEVVKRARAEVEAALAQLETMEAELSPEQATTLLQFPELSKPSAMMGVAQKRLAELKARSADKNIANEEVRKGLEHIKILFS